MYININIYVYAGLYIHIYCSIHTLCVCYEDDGTSTPSCRDWVQRVLDKYQMHTLASAKLLFSTTAL